MKYAEIIKLKDNSYRVYLFGKNYLTGKKAFSYAGKIKKITILDSKLWVFKKAWFSNYGGGKGLKEIADFLIKLNYKRRKTVIKRRHKGGSVRRRGRR